MMNSISYTTTYVVLCIFGLLMILHLLELRIAVVFAKDIIGVNSFKFISIDNNPVNTLNISKNISLSSKNTSVPINSIFSNSTQQKNHSTSSLPSAKIVSIVKGAALLREKAFDPNPIIIHAQDSINWINKDNVVHTVTSGSSFSSPDRGQEFDSGMLGGSYTHKFVKSGTYNYFCQIHPTMVGKIIVK
jgi:plastocyanin